MKTYFNLSIIFLISILVFSVPIKCQTQCSATVPAISAIHSAIKLGSTEFISATVSNGATAFKWTTSCSDGITINNPNSLNTSIFVANNSTCCDITLTLSYTVTIANASPSVCSNSGTINIKILPNLFATTVSNSATISVVYPCETFSLVTKHKNNNSCAAFCIGSGSYNWYRSWGGSIASFQGDHISITFGNSSVPNSVLIDCNFQDCVQGGGYFPLDQLTLSVKLRNPNINGNSSIGCGGSSGSGGTSYTASYVCGASYWVWNYDPAKFTVIGSANSSSIVLNAIDTAAFTNISVQAFASSGSQASSDVVAKTIAICCISSKTFADNVTVNNYTREADSQINTTNTITAAAGATMHAGDEVRLNPGFQIHAGAQVHLYNLGCTGTYARQAYNPYSDSTFILHVYTPPSYDASEINPNQNNSVNWNAENKTSNDIQNKESITDEITANDIQLFPNPNNGIFTILFSNSKGTVYSIFIYNTLGKNVLAKNNLTEKRTNFDANELSNGLYNVQINIDSIIFSKRLIIYKSEK